MKKIITTGVIAFALLLVGVTTNAQDKPLSFGLKGGLNLSNYGGDAEGAKAKIGFNVGLTADYALSQGLYLQSGLELTTKGAKTKGIDVTMNPIYLQLPVHLAYKMDVVGGSKVVFFAGPYLAYGIGGKFKVGASAGDTNVEVSTDIFGDKLYKRFDLGVGGGVGLEFGKIGVSLGYDLGLINTMSNGLMLESNLEGVKMTNQNAYLSLGYSF